MRENLRTIVRRTPVLPPRLTAARGHRIYVVLDCGHVVAEVSTNLPLGQQKMLCEECRCGTTKD